MDHPTRISPQNTSPTQTSKSDLLIQKIIMTMVAIQVQADEVGDDVDIAVRRCQYLQARGSCNRCPLWDGKVCLAAKWKEIMVEDYGWTPELIEQLQAFVPNKQENEENDSEYQE